MKASVYFVLYLAVVLEILIIIVDRDDAEDELRSQIEALVPLVVTPPTGGIENQVYRIYVDANDTTGRTRTDRSISDFVLRIKGLKGDLENLKDVRKKQISFYSTRKVLSDSQIVMLPKESLQVALADTPSVQVRAKKKSEDPQLIDLPLVVNPKGSLVGVYQVLFEISSDQVHFIPEGSDHPAKVKFGNVSVPYAIIEQNVQFRNKLKDVRDMSPAIVKRYYDHSEAPLYIAIIDTSVPHGTPQPQLVVSAADPPRQYAVGNELIVPLGIEGAERQQIVQIRATSQSGSSIGTVEHNSDMSAWWWKHVFSPSNGQEYEEVVILTGQDNRGAGSKSISPPTKFAIKAVPPALLEETGIPDKVCQNEPFTVNFQVRGLDKANLYELRLYVNGVEDIGKRVAKNPKFTFSLPSDMGLGTQIRVAGYYDGREYQYFDANLAQLKRMEHEWSLQAKPVMFTGFNRWGRSIALGGELKFSVYRACDPYCDDCKKPIEQPPQVKIIDAIRGDDVTDIFLGSVKLWDKANNEYLIIFKDNGTFYDPKNGDRVKIEIRAMEAVKSPEITIKP